MNKKIVLLITIIIAVAIIAMMVLTSDTYKIIKGNIILGDEECTYTYPDSDNKWLLLGGDSIHSMMSFPAETEWECKICGSKSVGSLPTPVLCYECEESTNRCCRCGKLNKY